MNLVALIVPTIPQTQAKTRKGLAADDADKRKSEQFGASHKGRLRNAARVAYPSVHKFTLAAPVNCAVPYK